MVQRFESVNRSADEDVGPVQGFRESASSVLNDGLDLAELQFRLLARDSQECARTAKSALLGGVVTLAMLIASLPVLANGIAQWISWAFDWPLWTCQILIGFLLTVAGLGIGFWCMTRMRVAFRSFESSRLEAAENARWLRRTLSRSLHS